MTDWMARWQAGQTGWHKEKINARLIEFVDCLALEAGDTVFVPLCGKSKDMAYLLEQGFNVIGVELSALAIEQFFNEHQLEYSIQQIEQFTVYQGVQITLYCGDYFALNATLLKSVTAVYDRASLIALPAALRAKYVAHLYDIISSGCKLLLLTLNYPQSQMSGPPYAVSQAEVNVLFGKGFYVRQLQCFNDINNEPMFQQAGVAFIEKAAYCLCKK